MRVIRSRLALLAHALLLALGTTSLAQSSEVDVVSRLDSDDRALLEQSLQDALELTLSGERSRWRNNSRRSAGVVWPVRTFRLESGQYCREYRNIVTLKGRSQMYSGYACRQSNGNWRKYQ